MMNAMQDNMRPTRDRDRVGSVVRFAAERLRGDSRIAAFSLNGFDTHAHQSGIWRARWRLCRRRF